MAGDMDKFLRQEYLAIQLAGVLERRGQTRHGKRSLLDIADDVISHYRWLMGIEGEQYVEHDREALMAELVAELKKRGSEDAEIWQITAELLLAYAQEYNW